MSTVPFQELGGTGRESPDRARMHSIIVFAETTCTIRGTLLLWPFGKTLQQAATDNTPQHTATHRGYSSPVATRQQRCFLEVATQKHQPQLTATHCDALQHTSTHHSAETQTNTQQYTAPHCNILQHGFLHMSVCRSLSSIHWNL